MKNNINEELKRREAAAAVQNESEEMTLDSTQRVKVLSPGKLVAKRFIRNKLAVIGTVILTIMFAFAFLGPLVYPYGQTEKFYKFDDLNVKYGIVNLRTEYVPVTVDGELDIPVSLKNMVNSHIKQMKEAGETARTITQNDVDYQLIQVNEYTYKLDLTDRHTVATYMTSIPYGTYNKINKTVTGAPEELSAAVLTAIDNAVTAKQNEVSVEGATYLLTAQNKLSYTVQKVTDKHNGVFTYPEETMDEAFEQEVRTHLDGGSFTMNGITYVVEAGDTVKVLVDNGRKTALAFSNYVFDLYDVNNTLSEEFKAAALLAENNTFTADGVTYTITENEGDLVIMNGDVAVAEFSTYAVRRYSGEDSLSIEFKEAASEKVAAMMANNERSGSFSFRLPMINADGEYEKDENGNFTMVDTAITVERSNEHYVLSCEQKTFLIDIYGAPSAEHIFGTDSDGYDVLARMMFGGRVSLLVGFVVVILETILGVIMGGIAGYFGGWVDTLIMRLVDIFNCIPSMPILIILGAFFDAMKMTPYVRLIWMMAVLGILGWSGVARLVRGQILSLREQEFMVATEACGLSVSKRIFRHLVPNVMPQLIVTATAGLGGVIITESTLSFLGLGVKHPLATWGTMINSATASSETMIKYTYIWIPVGLLICLTVIAFNFVGDGLRDAFDPKMKR